MVIDTVFPGWMPWRRFAVLQDVFDEFARVEDVRKMDWNTVVGGHVTRVGTHADVEMQAEFHRDIKQAAATALATTKIGLNLTNASATIPSAIVAIANARGAALPANRTARDTLKAIANDGPTIDKDMPSASRSPNLRLDKTLHPLRF